MLTIDLLTVKILNHIIYIIKAASKNIRNNAGVSDFFLCDFLLAVEVAYRIRTARKYYICASIGL